MIHIVPDSVLPMLMNYMVHSTLFIALVMLLVRSRQFRELRTKLLLWRLALLGGILTTLLQSNLDIDSFKIEVESHNATEDRISSGLFLLEEPTDDMDSDINFDQRAGNSDEPIDVPVSGVFGAVGLLLLFRMFYTRRRFVHSLNPTAVTDQGLLKIFQRLRLKFDLKDNISLVSSTRVSGPIVLTYKQICIPERVITELKEQNHEALLAHELGHLKNRDPQWLMFANIITNVFFFQPLNRLVRYELKRAMEEKADGLAVEMTGKAIDFAETLIVVAKWNKLNLKSYGLEFAKKSKGLKGRVETILERKEFEQKPQSKWAISALLIILFSTVSFVSPQFSNDSKEASPWMPMTQMPEVIGIEPMERNQLVPMTETTQSSPESAHSKGDNGTVATISKLTLEGIRSANRIPPIEIYKPSPQPYSVGSTGFEKNEAPMEVEQSKVQTDHPHDRNNWNTLTSQYEEFKKVFWPTLISSGLLTKRINTVEITYEFMTVNGKQIRESDFGPFQRLIEVHLDQSHWIHFQYRRDRFNKERLKSSLVAHYPDSSQDFSESSYMRDEWAAYRAELAEALLEDGVIKSLSDNISIKWRKGKVFINRKKFTGHDFTKYRSIKNKHFPVRET